MGLKDLLRRILGKPTIQSASKALQIDNQALQSASASLQSVDSKEISLEVPETSQIEVEKDSLQLGIAAGYAGRYLKDIESSLNRIEAQMVTKDWFILQIKPDLERRLDSIQMVLDEITSIVSGSPEPIRTAILNRVSSIEQKLPLTPKMESILNTLREVKEISYEDLALKLGVQVSALRGLLSSMAKRTDKIERFEKGVSGWVKIKEI